MAIWAASDCKCAMVRTAALLRSSGGAADPQIVPVAIKQALHEEVAPYKSVLREARARFTQHRGNRYLLRHLRHMAVLTARCLLVLTVPPFLIGNLLRQFPNHLSLGVERHGQEGMASGAQF